MSAKEIKDIKVKSRKQDQEKDKKRVKNTETHLKNPL